MQTTTPQVGFGAENVITAASLLHHWQGHRRLTRRVIEAFPDEQLFTFTIGGMRPFGDIAWELIRMAGPIARGVATREWTEFSGDRPAGKQELLRVWDEETRSIDAVWARIPAGRFNEVDSAFGMYEGTVWSHVLYAIDNEVHHRGQAYVYLRALGVEPPAFWER